MAAFLKSFFKPKWQHSSADVRLQAIDQGLDSATLAILAKSDEDQKVRSAAIHHLTDLSILSGLFAAKDTKSEAVTQYLKVVLNTDVLEEQIKQVANISDPNILMTIASVATNNDLVEAALAIIKDESVLFEYIMQASSAKARQLAIESVTNLDNLKAIEKAYRNKDKTLVKLAKAKVQKAAEEQDKQDQAKLHTQNLAKQAATLASQSFSPEYVGKLTYLKQQWESAQYKENFATEFNNAIATCEATAKENEQAQKALEQEQEKLKAATSLHNKAINAAQALFDEAKSRNNLKSSDATEQVKSIQQTWFEAQEIHKADKNLQQDFNTLIKPIINLDESLTTLATLEIPAPNDRESLQTLQKVEKDITKTQRTVNWPNEFATPQTLIDLDTRLTEIRNKLQSLKGNEKDALSKLNKDLSALEKEISEGNLNQANKLTAQIKKLFAQVDPKRVNKESQRFQLLQNQLNDLQDWKGFAAQPKFQSLIDEMTALQGSEMDPKELAKQIHSLQEQWKSLGSLGDKKLQNQLWSSFKAAADVAYEPCKAFYDDQSKVRQFNKEQRELICSELEALFEQQDWSNANYKALQKIIDKAYSEYKKFAPVDRDVNRDLQQRFNTASNQLKEKLRAYYQSNADEKQALIDQCTSLIEEEDLAAAIERCKTLQQEWKTIENAGRHENELWTKFREACDKVFERRTAQNQAKRAETDQNIADAEKLLAEAKTLADQGNSSDLSKIDEIKQQVDQIDMPPKVKSAIIKQIYNAKDALVKTVEQQKESAENQKWENALTLSDRLSELEILNEDKSEAASWISEADLPKGCKDVFLERLSASQASVEALNELCLEMEISLGLESPATDKDKRMAYQVQLLQQNMGKPNLPRHQQIQALQKQWFAQVAQDNGYTEFRQRFVDGIAKAQGKSLASA